MMMHSRRVVAAVAILLWAAATASAQSSSQNQQDSLVRDALERYQAGLDAIHRGEDATPAATAAAQANRPIRDIRLTDVVELALQKNLDIAVERLNPQAVDLQIAGIRNTYLPVASSTLGQRDNYQLPRDQLQGGQRVSVATTTYNAGVAQNLPWYGGNFSLTWNNAKRDSSSAFATFNPTYETVLTASYTQPLLRGFFIDQTRQQLEITQINREVAEETLRATVTQTLANVRNAYWDLVFARNAVEVAQRALQLADKLVEDNKARVEVGTLAPLDIVQAEAESATRRQAVALAFSLVDQTKIVTAASELARNVVQHAGGGQLTIEQVGDGARRGLRLTFEDQGPGITDLERALRGGYSTGGGLGLGLSGSKRLSNEFEIESTVGKVTRVVITRWR